MGPRLRGDDSVGGVSAVGTGMTVKSTSLLDFSLIIIAV